MHQKTWLDKLVAERLGKNREQVRDITAAFIDIVREEIVKNGQTHIPQLGTFNVVHSTVHKKVRLIDGTFQKNGHGREREVHVQHQVRIFFSKAPRLKKELREAWKSTE